MHRNALAAALSLVLVASTAIAQEPALESDQQKTLYALGVAMGMSVEDFSLTEEELAIVASGLRDSVLGNEARVDMQTYGPLIQSLADERASQAAAEEKAASSEFLEEQARRDGAEQTDSGLVFIPVEEGSGETPAADDAVRVHYHGTLRDGTVFDSSRERGEPVTLGLDGVIPCWTEGLQLMSVGGRAELVCPADLAYGDEGTGPIPGGATLKFEIELLGIDDSAAAGQPAAPQAQ